MWYQVGTIISCIVISRVSCGGYQFDEDFFFCAGGSAAQIEGAYDADGKALSTWDVWTQQSPSPIYDGATTEITCDSYHKYKEDVQLMKNLGLDGYRMSISWPRVLPKGFADEINEAGIQYYIDVITELQKNGIEPIVVLSHWDHPQVLEDLGGWMNPMMVELYRNYAEVIFDRLSHIVKIFTTFNEPILFCSSSYGDDIITFAPGKKFDNYGPYICVHHMLKAHAEAYHLFDEKYRCVNNGTIGVTIDTFQYIPKDPSNPSDVQAAAAAFEHHIGWFAEPIWNGGYPKILRENVDAVSKAECRSHSRLPEFTEDEIKRIRGTSDWMGVNYYVAYYARFSATPHGHTVFNDSGVDIELAGPEDTVAAFRLLLRQIKQKYNNPRIIITENGYFDTGGLDDYERVNFFHTYVKAIWQSIHEDDANVGGYCFWSLMDNFEWFRGYTLRLGVHQVDFESPNRERTPKASAKFWKKFLSTRNLSEKPDAPE